SRRGPASQPVDDAPPAGAPFPPDALAEIAARPFEVDTRQPQPVRRLLVDAWIEAPRAPRDPVAHHGGMRSAKRTQMSDAGVDAAGHLVLVRIRDGARPVHDALEVDLLPRHD